MKVLVLGGTSFLSKAVAAEGVRRGHEVTCVARGKSGDQPPGAVLVKLDRDVPGAIDVLNGQRFDAVVDVTSTSLRWVTDALAAVDADHWTFVSSINTYADTATMHQTTEAPVLRPIAGLESVDLEGTTPEQYGALKVACENAVRETGRALILRPGQITGPGDYMDRFSYWPARFHRGGKVVVPDVAAHPFQHIDVRDLAEWMVTSAEQRLTGVFDAVSPVADFAETLRQVAEMVAPQGTEIVPVPEQTLIDAGVGHWLGPKTLPCWLPESFYGMVSHDASTAYRAGLQIRPLAETVRSALAEELAKGFERDGKKAGLTPAEEDAVLSLVR